MQLFNLINNYTMYITGILQYLIWPAFIFAAWYIIKAGVEYYEKKFPADEERE